MPYFKSLAFPPNKDIDNYLIVRYCVLKKQEESQLVSMVAGNNAKVYFILLPLHITIKEGAIFQGVLFV